MTARDSGVETLQPKQGLKEAQRRTASWDQSMVLLTETLATEQTNA